MAATPGFSLFWRTLLLLVMLLAGAVFAWVQSLRAMEFGPRAVQEAQQIARLVNLAGSALSHGEGGRRAALAQAMDRPPVRLLPRGPGDRFEPYEVDRFSRRVAAELRAALGTDAEMASSVGGEPGPWVGFAVGPDRYWLQAAGGPEAQPAFTTWAA